MNHEFFKGYTHGRLQGYTHRQMAFTYWFVFVYDRTQADVLRVAELNGKYLGRTITPEEKEEWMAGIKGALNVLDLRRIEWNTRLIGEFEMLKLSVSPGEWDYGDIPTVSDFVRILDNVQEIRGALPAMPYTPEVPVQPLNTYQKWNDIEKIMHDVAHLYAGMAGSLYYAGDDIFAGEGTGTM